MKNMNELYYINIIKIHPIKCINLQNSYVYIRFLCIHKLSQSMYLKFLVIYREGESSEGGKVRGIGGRVEN